MKKENEMSEKTYSFELSQEASRILDAATEEERQFIVKELEKFLEKLKAEANEKDTMR
jgi:hypothetical protein